MMLVHARDDDDTALCGSIDGRVVDAHGSLSLVDCPSCRNRIGIHHDGTPMLWRAARDAREVLDRRPPRVAARDLNWAVAFRTLLASVERHLAIEDLDEVWPIVAADLPTHAKVYGADNALCGELLNEASMLNNAPTCEGCASVIAVMNAPRDGEPAPEPERIDSPYDGKTMAEVIHDYAVTRGDLSEQYARDQLVRIIEDRIASARTVALTQAQGKVGDLRQRLATGGLAQWGHPDWKRGLWDVMEAIVGLDQ